MSSNKSVDSALRKSNMPAYLPRHDLVYEAPPLRWDEGIPLGNGSMGVMAWGDGAPLHLTVSHYGQWDLRTPEWHDARYSYDYFKDLYRKGKIGEIRDFFSFRTRKTVPTRLPAMRLDVTFGARPKTYEARLSLADATARGRIQFDKGRVDWSAYLASEEDLLVVELSRRGVGRASVGLAKNILTPQAVADLKAREFRPPEEGRSGDIRWTYQAIPENGGQLLAWRRIAGSRNDETLLVTFLTGASQAELLQQARSRLDRTGDALDAVRRKHVSHWRAYWQKSSLHVPDHRIESLYYAEMYKFGCVSRPGRFPITLQGPWAGDDRMADWHGGHHSDLNLQLSYWPAYASNHLDLAQPFYDWVERLMPRFREECRRFFKRDGAFVPCSLALNGNRIYGWETCEQWPGNGAWHAWHFWLHYLYSRDETFLKERAYPVMREFMNLYVGLLEKGKDGRYHLPLSTSPEYSHNSPAAWGKDTAGDLALIRALGEALLQCVQRLKLAEPRAARWRDVLNHLAPYPSAATGRPKLHEEWEKQRLALGMPNDPWLTELPPNALFVMHEVPYYFSHPHLTHLMALYPLGLLSVEGSPAEQKTVYDSIRTLWHFGPGRWAGQNMGWASCLASRARMPAMALHMLQEYADHFISANTFHVNGDYRETGASAYTLRVVTLESGFAFAGAVMEMLLQSWGGKIRVFPGVPAEWQDAGFRDLRAEGAFLVSAKREKGETVWVEIRSERGGRCALVNPFPNEQVVFEDLATHERRRLSGMLLAFPTKPGNTYRLFNRKLAGNDLRLVTPSAAALEKAPFGLKGKL